MSTNLRGVRTLEDGKPELCIRECFRGELFRGFRECGGFRGGVITVVGHVWENEGWY